VETSRHLPDHVAAMVIPAEQSAASLVGWPLEQQHIVRPLGLSLGLGLMTLGRFLYNPCLFYLPAVLLGYAMIQPMSAYLTAEMGLSHHAIALLGASLGIGIACLQRHVVVWLFGMLLGVLAFIGLYITTEYLNNMPIQLLGAILFAFGLAGSSIMLKLERTYVWKVLACAFVGSVLFTDAIGLSQLSCAVRYGEYCLVQYAICLVLVLLSCYHQVTAYRRAQKEREERERRLREAREEEEREKARGKAREKRRRTVGADGRDSQRPASLGSTMMALLSPRKSKPRPQDKPPPPVEEEEEEEEEEDSVGVAEANRGRSGSLFISSVCFTGRAVWAVTTFPFALARRAVSAPKVKAE